MNDRPIHRHNHTRIIRILQNQDYLFSLRREQDFAELIFHFVGFHDKSEFFSSSVFTILYNKHRKVHIGLKEK